MFEAVEVFNGFRGVLVEVVHEFFEVHDWFPSFFILMWLLFFAGWCDGEAPGEAYRVLKRGGFVEDG